MSDQHLPVPPLRIPFESLRSKLGGYERAATTKLIEEIAAAYEAVWLECAALRKTEAELRAELAHAKEVGGPLPVEAAGSASEFLEEARREAQLVLKKARRRAEKAARRAEREARAKADRIVSDARHEVEREVERREAELPAAARLADPTGSAAEIVDQARREAQLVLKKAQTKAEKIITDARRDRRELELEIDRLGAIASETRDELSAFLLAAVKWYREERNGRAPLETALEPKRETMSADSEQASAVPESLESPSERREEPGERSGLERIAALLEAVERRRELEVRLEIEEAMDASS